MISPRHPLGSAPRGDHDEDDDPTGVRDLLSSLPDPAPMPEHLRARISATLAAEARATPPPTAAAHRRPRRSRVAAVLAGVAAVAVVGVGATAALHQQLGRPGSARAAGPRLGARPTTPATHGATTGTTDGATGGTTDGTGAPSATAPDMHIQDSGTHYTDAGFTLEARVMMSHQAGASPAPGRRVGKSRAAGPLSTTAGLAECARALGLGPTVQVSADIGYYDDAPAVVIVATTPGRTTAYAVSRRCTKDHPGMLRPPAPLS